MRLKVLSVGTGGPACELPVGAGWDRPGQTGTGRGRPEQAGALPYTPLCAAIEADGRDVKALFRRSQALQQLGRLDQAVSDLQRCVSLEPRNKAFQEALRALGSSMHEKVSRGALGGCWPTVAVGSRRRWRGLSHSFCSVADEGHVLHGLKSRADVPDLAGS